MSSPLTPFAAAGQVERRITKAENAHSLIVGKVFWHNHEDTKKSLRLLGKEVLPAVREMGRELGLIDPYERKPGSRPLSPSGVREPVAGSLTAVAAL